MVSRLNLFEDLDRMDADAWVAHLAPDVVMQFANEDPVYGRVPCRERVVSLFDSVASVSHHIVAHWEHGDATIVEAAVTFQRGGDDDLTIPMVTIFRTEGHGLIADYRVYLDPSGLWS